MVLIGALGIFDVILGEVLGVITLYCYTYYYN